VQLDAYDVSAEQFPARASLPANVALYTADVKVPFPEALHGRYDIVHLRLLVCALEKEDWRVVADNVLRLLKPGGYIQWDEGDHFNSKQLRGAGADSTISSLKKAADKFALGCGHRLRYGWSTLPGIFTGDFYRDGVGGGGE
jgi:hypothetical protein